jgi:hypothetical protein
MNESVASLPQPKTGPSRWVLTSAFLIGVCAALACSPKKTTFDSLLNQGIVPISSENPYNGANLFLSHEMEQSAYLYDFVRNQGAPQAIELTGNPDDLQAHFFYAGTKQEYLAKPAPRRAGVNDGRQEWIIIGPYAVDREHYRELDQMTDNGGAFEVFGRREFFGKKLARAGEETLRPVFIPTPTPKPVRKKKHSGSPHTVQASQPAPSGPPNFDQQSLAEAKHHAHRNAQGDLEHTVKSATETLQSVTKWYTGSDVNVKAVAEKNGMPADAKLKPGAKVVIPSGVVINPNEMK